MAVRIGDTLKQINNADFPIVEAMDVAFESGDTLQELYDSGALSGGGGASYITLSQEEYDVLSDEEKVNGSEYRTYDTGHIYKLGIEYGKDSVQISDNETVENKTWSSQKTSSKIAEEVTGAIDTINTSLANYSIPLNLYMGINHYLAIKINIHNMNYSFNMSDRSGYIYEGAFFSYNGSFSIQITKVNNSSTKNGYILGFRQYKVSDSEIYLVAKVSDYNYINGVINTPSILKSNIEILVNDDSTLWDKGTDIVVKELATMDKVNASLGELSTLNTVKKSDANECILDKEGQGNFYVEYEGSNLPNNEYSHWYINTVAQNKNAQKQVAYSTHTDRIYIRKYVSYKFSAWTELATMDKVNYSTTETPIGTWIDGKPIYRKVISFPSFELKPCEWNIVNSLSITGIDEIINARAKRSVDNVIIPLAVRSSGVSSIEVNTFANFSISKLILEYTKQ